MLKYYQDERRRHERALRREEDLLETLFDLAEDLDAIPLTEAEELARKVRGAWGKAIGMRRAEEDHKQSQRARNEREQDS